MGPAEATSVRGDTALDTSIIVAAHMGWHEHHTAARSALERALSGPGQLLLPARALLEAYSVMTRLPAPHRLAPNDALALLARTFERAVRIVDLPSADLWSFLRRQVEAGVAGGTLYDAEILQAALAGGADHLLTLNRRDFERLAPAGLHIETPA